MTAHLPQPGSAGSHPRRIAIVGVTGAGKTTLAGELAALHAIPTIELDALHWGPHWVPAPDDDFRERVAAATAAPAWVTDGNYRVVRDILWARADTLIWLDYPLPISLWRLARRTLVRTTTGVELWHGNRETLREQFLSRDSIFLWALRSYRRHRREFPAAFAEPAYAHLTIVRLLTPRAAAHWLATLRARVAP